MYEYENSMNWSFIIFKLKFEQRFFFKSDNSVIRNTTEIITLVDYNSTALNISTSFSNSALWEKTRQWSM